MVTVIGFNDKAKLTVRKANGIPSNKVSKTAQYQTLAKEPVLEYAVSFTRYLWFFFTSAYSRLFQVQ